MNLNLMDDMKAGIREAKRGNTRIGMELLQGFAMRNNFPEAKAWFGYCLAYEIMDISAGITFCKAALNLEPRLSDGYLALARIYLHLGNRKQAIDVLQQGMNATQNQEIQNLLRVLGVRKRPIIPFLTRDNFLNVSLGRLLARVGLR